MADVNRYCPLCDAPVDEELCPTHGVPTVLLDSLESEDEDTLEAGAIIGGRYRVEHLLGHGGMGAVFLATQMSMDRKVALKTLRKSLVNNQTLVKRFYQEARSSSHLDHPNIIRIFDFGIDHVTGIPYIAMEYLKGQTLEEIIESGAALSEVAICDIMQQVAKALVEAHQKGVIHRDLKPENIMVRRLADGELQVKVLDFGISKVIREGSLGGTSLTGTGNVVGTPLYMSPEQATGVDLDFRSDLYSMGCVLYEICAGKPPFDAKDAVAILMKHVSEPAPKLPDALPNGDPPSSELRSLYQRMVTKDRESRPVSTSNVRAALKAIVRGTPVNMTQLLGEASLAFEEDTDVGIHAKKPASGGVADTDPDIEVNRDLARTTTDALDRSISLPKAPTRPWVLVAGLFLVLLVGASILISRGGETASVVKMEDSVTNDENSDVDSEPYRDLFMSACMDPALKDGVSEEHATEYCACMWEKGIAKWGLEGMGENLEKMGPEARAMILECGGDMLRAERPAVEEPSSQEVVPSSPALPAYMFTLSTEPDGAKVYDGDVLLGKTPHNVAIPEGVGFKTLTIKRKGYKSQEVVVNRNTPSPLQIKLKRTRVRPSPSTSSPKPPPAPKKPNKRKVPVW